MFFSSPIHIGPRLSLHILDALSEPSSLSLPFWLNIRQRMTVGLCPSSANDAAKMWNLSALPLIIMDYIVPVRILIDTSDVLLNKV